MHKVFHLNLEFFIFSELNLFLFKNYSNVKKRGLLRLPYPSAGLISGTMLVSQLRIASAGQTEIRAKQVDSFPKRYLM
jgi:hypothetical protein